MVAYSIKDLEKLSSVKAHTLRIWEKRYGIIIPHRTNTNIRYYTDEDLQKILNISLLNKHGLKISKIAQLTDNQIKRKVAEFTQVGLDFEDHVDALTLATFELDEAKFYLILDHEIESKGFEYTIINILYPLLDKLGTMWLAGSIKSVHERFVVNIIKSKLIVEINKLNNLNKTYTSRCLIYLPENETHELSLLFLQCILVKESCKVINLGSNISLIDVIEGHIIFKPEYIFTIFNDSFTDSPLQPYIDELSRNVNVRSIFISGFQVMSQNLHLPANTKVINSILDVPQMIKLGNVSD